MIISDMHMHTSFSSDSESSPESMIEESIKKGLKIIAITDHYDKDNYDWGHEDIYDEVNYYPTILALKEKYKEKIDIRIGTEIGIQPHLPAFYKEFTKKYAFDFLIGSAHCVQGHDSAYGLIFKEHSDEKAYEIILKEMVEDTINFTDEFDVLGHIDYFVRYGKEKERHFSYSKYADYIDELLKNLIEKDRGIEINTSGFKYGLSQPHPNVDIIKRYRELGGEIITVGADGHEPKHIAFDFHRVPEILTDCGFRYYTVFKERKPEFISLF